MYSLRNLFSALILSAFLLSACRNDNTPLVENRQELHYSKQGAVKFVTVDYDISLKQFANMYGISAKELAAHNNISVNAYLYRGQMIRVPAYNAAGIDGEVLFMPDASIEQGYIEESRSLMGENGADLVESGISDNLKLNEVGNITNDKEFLDTSAIDSDLEEIRAYSKSNANQKKDVKNLSQVARVKKVEQVQSVISNPIGSKNGFKYTNPLNSKEFVWPVSGKVLVRYNDSANKSHEGINISAPAGSKIKATAGGEVIYVGREPKVYGNLIVIKHKDGYLSAYAHSEKILVKKGSIVKQGDVIGLVGSSGAVKSPQLHFSMRKGKKTIDPESEIQ